MLRSSNHQCSGFVPLIARHFKLISPTIPEFHWTVRVDGKILQSQSHVGNRDVHDGRAAQFVRSGACQAPGAWAGVLDLPTLWTST